MKKIRVLVCLALCIMLLATAVPLQAFAATNAQTVTVDGKTYTVSILNDDNVSMPVES